MIERKRKQLRAMCAEAARQLAELLLARGDPRGAIEVCRNGIGIDRYADTRGGSSCEADAGDGDLAGHARATAQYDVVVAELSIARRP